MEMEGPLPRFSLDERDRRHRRVRAAMAERGLDCLLVPHNTGDWDNLQPDVRYLTCVGGAGTAAAAVFPLDGDPVALVREGRRIAFWKAAQAWVEDIRAPKDAVWSEALAEALLDRGMEKARIGVVGLAGVLREPEGVIAHGEFAAIRARFPYAAFENATDLMHAVRMVKSAEEIAMIERAQACADAISAALFATAAVGVAEHDLYAELLAAHVRAGGEVPSMILMAAEAAPNQTFLMPTRRRLAAGDVVLVECEPKYFGYMAQNVEVLCLGRAPDEYRRLFEASLACFHRLLEAARPGVPYADLLRLWEHHMQRAGARAAPTLGHGLGLGQDGPVTRPGGDAQGHVVAAGHCLILKPWASSADGRHAVRTGAVVVVEDSATRRLGAHELKLRELV